MSDNGGGIFNDGGYLELNQSEVIGNVSNVHGGGIYTQQPDQGNATLVLIDTTVDDNETVLNGGGIYNLRDDVRITRSTISNNRTTDGNGAGIFNEGNLTVANSTLSGNTADADGGGIYNNFSGGNALLLNITVTLNQSLGLLNSGIHNSGRATDVRMGNSIVAGNNVDCSGPITSLGNNLDGDGTCLLAAAGDRPNADANLGPLADNGGPTLTHALLTDSDAIDAGNEAICQAPPVDGIDQRGVERPQDGDGVGGAVCDIGAFELEEEEAPPTPTPTRTPIATLTPTPSPTPGRPNLGGIFGPLPQRTPVAAGVAQPAAVTPPRTGDAGLR
jgi:hypothetical protein